jgi:hypothetical protein
MHGQGARASGDGFAPVRLFISCKSTDTALPSLADVRGRRAGLSPAKAWTAPHPPAGLRMILLIVLANWEDQD